MSDALPALRPLPRRRRRPRDARHSVAPLAGGAAAYLVVFVAGATLAKDDHLALAVVVAAALGSGAYLLACALVHRAYAARGKP